MGTHPPTFTTRSIQIPSGSEWGTRFENLNPKFLELITFVPRCKRRRAFRDGCTKRAPDLREPDNRRHRENASCSPVSAQREPMEKPQGWMRSYPRVPQVLGKTRHRGFPFSHHTKCKHRRSPAERRDDRKPSRLAAFCKMCHQLLVADLLRGILPDFGLAAV